MWKHKKKNMVSVFQILKSLAIKQVIIGVMG